VIAVVGVTRRAADDFLIDCDPGDGEMVLARLQRFRLRVDVEFALSLSDVDIPAEVELSRIREGWPRGGREIVAGETIPAELSMLNDLVSFTKGCYPGQELVERMDARSSSAPFEIIQMSGDFAVGSEVVVDGKSIGVVTSAAGGSMLVRARRQRNS
jgi:folate-binding protein YgfZ